MVLDANEALLNYWKLVFFLGRAVVFLALIVFVVIGTISSSALVTPNSHGSGG
jgi:uncharacterized protein YpmS